MLLKAFNEAKSVWDVIKVDEDKAKCTPPPEDVLGRVSRRIQGLLLFNNETNQWMRYGAKFNGIWAAESENAMQQIVTNAILAKGYEGWGSHHYVVNVLLSMRSALLQREWNEKPTNEFFPVSA